MSETMPLNFTKRDNPLLPSISSLYFTLEYIQGSKYCTKCPADGTPVILIHRREAVSLQAESWTVQGLTMCKSTSVLKCLTAEAERKKERERENTERQSK